MEILGRFWTHIKMQALGVTCEANFQRLVCFWSILT